MYVAEKHRVHKRVVFVSCKIFINDLRKDMLIQICIFEPDIKLFLAH